MQLTEDQWWNRPLQRPRALKHGDIRPSPLGAVEARALHGIRKYKSATLRMTLNINDQKFATSALLVTPHQS